MRICYIYILQLLILFQTMYSSDTISRNNMSSSNISGANSMLFSTSNYYKHGFDGDFLKSKDMTMMASSDPFQHHQQQQQHQQQNNGGLTRYRSAPSTFFASFLDGTSANNGATSDSSHGEDEAETMFSAFMEVRDLKESNHQQQQQQQQMQFSSNLKRETMEYEQQQDGFSTDNSQLVYETSINGGGSGNGSYGALMENQMQGRINGNGNCSNNLVRQSSSPAGFFTGFDVMREIGSLRASNGTHGESNSVTNGLNNHMNFTSRPSSTSRFMPSIAENVDGNTGTGNTENEHMGSVNDAHGFWNDSTSNSLKRNRDGDIKMFSTFNGLENQNGDSRNFTSGLTHHLSLPKTSGEMAAIEKYLQFQQDAVPCKVRARRGCATHPRSIAERMRRTRISERMKKLQELFPNMDKQTNTADMLDLAVDYIKDLQKQVQTLTDVKAKCTCSSK